MTTKIEVLALIDFLSATLADQSECDRLFDEVMQELAHDARAWCSQIAVSNSGLLADNSDPDEYELRAGTVRLLAMFYGGRQLSEEHIHCLAGSNPRWREDLGEPWAYTREGENGRTLRLYPKPNRNPIQSQNISTGYLQGPLYLYTDVRTTAIPDILCLPLALLVLAREFERESHHRDQPTAEIWRAMAQNLMNRVY